ncbi:hypothetical protein MJO28_002859 [Puccinia striiformis f. sp. tritici]|uniref:Uncharacterized protein n=4 Tax=Puccinia striiformis TaxID=27350 RepID=A0A0L0VK53_9BASI|nr:hypothetical protein Pst134EA_005190 [Puccinia striiformis f. sp. tritici]KAI9619327.1 hypothetical protein H4Q26_012011 [Puccinia striiformis f. sp. tritici PST-130]KNE99657.1 hypothetical protein PSTG_07149 [Puccinia striiformis f. sp. tritici PST-78]POV97054.1 hypothetical protein PSTT_15290 [Puccinia striiformis]KAH9462356.1 hypothetical protein Pst134EB_006255 [Puccinia striiformis f. sp. tritici]KAH9471283.1 hypothetical protein Pst134EA_005190 [Puccinia striiformis f. sp. tritici]
MKCLQALFNILLMCSLVPRQAAVNGHPTLEHSTGIEGLDVLLSTSSSGNKGRGRQEGPQKIRRGVALAGHYPYSREVKCKNADGLADTYQSKDCISAAKLMSVYQLSEMTCNTCKLSLVKCNGALIPSVVSEDRLRHMTDLILKACVLNKHINATCPDQDTDASNAVPFVLLLSKGNGTQCKSRTFGPKAVPLGF